MKELTAASLKCGVENEQETMDSKFVVQLRSLQSSYISSRRPSRDAEEHLYLLSDELINECKKRALKSKRGIEYLKVSLNEINAENEHFEKRVQVVNQRIGAILSTGAHLEENVFKELNRLEDERNYLKTILNCITDTKSQVYQVIMAYYPETDFSALGIQDLRNSLPIWNQYRAKFEATKKLRDSISRAMTNEQIRQSRNLFPDSTPLEVEDIIDGMENVGFKNRGNGSQMYLDLEKTLSLFTDAQKLFLLEGLDRRAETSNWANSPARDRVREYLEDMRGQKLRPKEKAFIEKEVESSNFEPSRALKFIKAEIEAVDSKGWQYSFLSEEDFHRFATLLSAFFDSKPFSLPEGAIRLRARSKSKVAKALNNIHKGCTERPLRSNTGFFEIVRVLSPFKGISDSDLYKDITR